MAPGRPSLLSLLALLALAGSGYLAWQDRASAADEAGDEAAIAALSGELDDAVTSLGSRQQAALAELQDAARQRTARINSLEREIQELKRKLNAVILAHYYQESEIQDVADFV